MAVGIKGISLSNDTHIDYAIDAKHQSANGEQNTNYAQQGRIRRVWPRSSRYQPHQGRNAYYKNEQSQQITEKV